MEIEKLKSIIESVLFSIGEPVKIAKLVKITDATKPEVDNALMMLGVEYAGANRGLTLLRKEDEAQLATNPENAAFVDQIIKSELQESLSNSALEVLSIIAYRGPLTRTDVEAIRGVNCSYTVRNLLMRGLIERIDNPKDNRGYVYKISFDFLKKMGLESVAKLPDFETLSQDERITSVIAQLN
jgi:segregation and condensation protein B